MRLFSYSSITRIQTTSPRIIMVLLSLTLTHPKCLILRSVWKWVQSKAEQRHRERWLLSNWTQKKRWDDVWILVIKMCFLRLISWFRALKNYCKRRKENIWFAGVQWLAARLLFPYQFGFRCSSYLYALCELIILMSECDNICLFSFSPSLALLIRQFIKPVTTATMKAG